MRLLRFFSRGWLSVTAFTVMDSERNYLLMPSAEQHLGEIVGGRYIVADAVDFDVAAFAAHFGFNTSREDESRMFLSVKDARANLIS